MTDESKKEVDSLKFSHEDTTQGRTPVGLVLKSILIKIKKKKKRIFALICQWVFTYFIAPVEILAHMIDTYSTSFNFP